MLLGLFNIMLLYKIMVDIIPFKDIFLVFFFLVLGYEFKMIDVFIEIIRNMFINMNVVVFIG